MCAHFRRIAARPGRRPPVRTRAIQSNVRSRETGFGKLLRGVGLRRWGGAGGGVALRRGTMWAGWECREMGHGVGGGRGWAGLRGAPVVGRRRRGEGRGARAERNNSLVALDRAQPPPGDQNYLSGGSGRTRPGARGGHGDQNHRHGGFARSDPGCVYRVRLNYSSRPRPRPRPRPPARAAPPSQPAVPPPAVPPPAVQQPSPCTFLPGSISQAERVRDRIRLRSSFRECHPRPALRAPGGDLRPGRKTTAEVQWEVAPRAPVQGRRKPWS
jgi:hypothetical protein